MGERTTNKERVYFERRKSVTDHTIFLLVSISIPYNICFSQKMKQYLFVSLMLACASAPFSYVPAVNQSTDPKMHVDRFTAKVQPTALQCTHFTSNSAAYRPNAEASLVYIVPKRKL